MQKGKSIVSHFLSILSLNINLFLLGGVLISDAWKVYPRAAREAGCTHFVVNHSKWFKDPSTGVHTNGVEGCHGLLKKDARRQFSRLPTVNDAGQTYYLDLVAFRVDQRLKAKQAKKKVNLFK